MLVNPLDEEERKELEYTLEKYPGLTETFSNRFFDHVQKIDKEDFQGYYIGRLYSKDYNTLMENYLYVRFVEFFLEKKMDRN